MLQVLKKVFPSKANRLLKSYQPILAEVNALEQNLKQLSDSELRQKTFEFKESIANCSDIKEQDALIQKIMPEAFALCREASTRVLGLRHYDVQILGGLVLFNNKIAEMRTGEGKTLVATLPVYLEALKGKGVHVVTVNDYLAKRDSEWMGRIYRFLGLNVGVVYSGQDHKQKKDAYLADVTYGTNNEFCFDYLRDNSSVYQVEDRVQRTLNFALVDEVDSILIDEARTPLIISGPAEDKTEIYKVIQTIVPYLEEQIGGKLEKTTMERLNEKDEPELPGDYLIDEKTKQVHLTEAGHLKVENLLAKKNLIKSASLYDAVNIHLLQLVNSALRANLCYEVNKDYIVENNQVIIIDEFTGRKMTGRRWSDGLHQAVEAKENVLIQQDSQTFASTTFQNYFREYSKISGMTGTAKTEEEEFVAIYNMEVISIPTNKPSRRADMPDLVYFSSEAKLKAIVKDVAKINSKGQPILVGTASINMSEQLSQLFKKTGIKHEILNAKQHEREAYIIANAGRPYAVTIATNMAGRGTDIVLGGNLEMELEQLKNSSETKVQKIEEDWKVRHQQVLDAGGLMVLGSERHESRRIDNQLRGRSGRQGDPGLTRFYLSLDDDLMRIFIGSGAIKNMINKVGFTENDAIENKMVSNSIERAQKKVEQHNQSIRKDLLKFDDVVSEQRKVVYSQRNDIMESDNIDEIIDNMRQDLLKNIIYSYCDANTNSSYWQLEELKNEIDEVFANSYDLSNLIDSNPKLDLKELYQILDEHLAKVYQNKMLSVADIKSLYEKQVLIQIIDFLWREHLNNLDYLKKGIGLRGFAQKDPFNEYKKESFNLFEDYLNNIKYEMIKNIYRVQLRNQEDVVAVQNTSEQAVVGMSANHADMPETNINDNTQESQKVVTYKREGKKVGRNEPCPCGSGRKYKHCHGKI